MNEKYSFKDLMNQDFRNVPAEEFNNSTIRGSNLYQEWQSGDVMKDIFPDVAGLVFDGCNLDNVLIKDGMTILDTDSGITSNRKICVQNDREDWVLNDSLEPVEPVNKKRFEKLGLSIDPVDIPAEMLDKSITQAKIDENIIGA